MSIVMNGVSPKNILIGDAQVVRQYVGSDLIWKKARLPAEYQEVEWIESSGTQYIDTGIIVSENIGFEMSVARMKTGSAGTGTFTKGADVN